ncbi:MAG: hypothetical protein AAF081_18355 [Actinomycetota bacterium]
MSHIVIHEDSAGATQYRPFDDLGSAVQFIEEQRNAGVATARLFELTEIHLAVTSYFKVEIADATSTAPAAATHEPVVAEPLADVPVAPVETARPEPMLAESTPLESMPVEHSPLENVPVEAVPPAVTDAVVEPIDDVSYVEAAMASPIEAFATDAPPLPEYNDAPEPAPSTEVRRGLFGR